MEVAMEDDVFFADLNRQISLLIMDDDEDDPVARHPSVSLQACPQPIFQQQQHPLPQTLNSPQDCIREIRGTGVFIPRSSQPRRKSKQQGGSGRNPSASYTTKSYNKKHLVSSRGVSRVAYTNSKPSYNYHINRFCSISDSLHRF